MNATRFYEDLKNVKKWCVHKLKKIELIPKNKQKAMDVFVPLHSRIGHWPKAQQLASFIKIWVLHSHRVLLKLHRFSAIYKIVLKTMAVNSGDAGHVFLFQLISRFSWKGVRNDPMLASSRFAGTKEPGR